MTYTTAEEHLYKIILRLMKEHEDAKLLFEPFDQVRLHCRALNLPALIETHDVIVKSFAKHFEHEERIIFPAFLHVSPTLEAGVLLEVLKREHVGASTRLATLATILKENGKSKLAQYRADMIALETELKVHAQTEFEKIYLVIRNSHDMKQIIIDAAYKAGLFGKLLKENV